MDFTCTNRINISANTLSNCRPRASSLSSKHHQTLQNHGKNALLSNLQRRANTHAANMATPATRKITNFAATTSANSIDSTSRRSLTKVESEELQLGKSSSAMEQLDIERGVCVPFRKYSPETVRNKVLESRGAILSLLGRGVEIVWSLGLYWSTLMYDCFVGRDEEVVPYRARQLRNLLCDLGPSFIKAGQVLANRPDIIREDYMNELCILQDDVPSFPNQVAFNIIEEELGQPLEAIFSKISSQTIAAASLGQVYRATLRDTGEDVAIKVVWGSSGGLL